MSFSCKNKNNLSTKNILKLINNFSKLQGYKIIGCPFKIFILKNCLYIFGVDSLNGWLTNLDINVIEYNKSFYHHEYLKCALNIQKYIKSKNIDNIIGFSAGAAIAIILINLNPYKYSYLITLCAPRAIDKLSCSKINKYVKWISITENNDPIQILGSDFSYNIICDKIYFDIKNNNISEIHNLKNYCSKIKSMKFKKFNDVIIDNNPCGMHMIHNDHKPFLYMIRILSFFVRNRKKIIIFIIIIFIFYLLFSKKDY